MSKPKIFEINFKNVPCEIFGCRNQAKYAIGVKDGHPSLWFKLCPECLKTVIKSCPEEFKPKTKKKKTKESKEIKEQKEKEQKEQKEQKGSKTVESQSADKNEKK